MASPTTKSTSTQDLVERASSLLVCPRCGAVGSPIAWKGDGVFCGLCRTTYPSRRGYVDFEPSPKTVSTRAQRFMARELSASIYTHVGRPLGTTLVGSLDWELSALPASLEGLRGKVVLDVGCGPGTFTRPLAALTGPDGLTIGLDVSRPMLSKAARLSAKAETPFLLIRGDIETPPLVPFAFDGICCAAGFHVFPNRDIAARRIYQLLKPGGIFVGTTYRARTGGAFKYLPSVSATTGLHFYDEGELERLLERVGFVDAGTQYHKSTIAWRVQRPARGH